MEILLENIVEKIDMEHLPDTWSFHDYLHFSNDKKLFDYQIDAVKKTVKALYYYYEKAGDFNEGESLVVNKKRKKAMYDTYVVKGLDPKLFEINNTLKNKWRLDLYSNYFHIEDEKIKPYHFMNRMSYWMATGSGKSIVIIKLFVILDQLMKNKEIPDHDILFLAPSEDLIHQMKDLVAEFNKRSGNPYIEFINLREFNAYKSNNRISLGEIPIFYYRSDLISDEQKESLIDFKEYDNNGNWYLFLDEAHKGDRHDSKRQSYYSILSRNGFSFHFSATFTDNLDIVTTVKDFKLSKFVTSGYGKNIYINRDQYDAFDNQIEEFTDVEKQKIVLKSLIALTYVKKCYKKIRKTHKDLYHSPLMITLVHSVNKTKSDLVLFFQEIEKISLGEYDQDVFMRAKNELYHEFNQYSAYEFNNGNLFILKDLFFSLNVYDILEEVFNSKSHGSIEVLTSNDNKELAFRLKTSDKTSSPFALIKIGDVGPWIKKHLHGYEFINKITNNNYFSELNNNPKINILLGSRAFYEGWDSSRPNILNYINIGSSTNARKYIMQSAGRGVRIEPVKGKRKRISELSFTDDIEDHVFHVVKDYAQALETLFIFATNKEAIREILMGMKEDNRMEDDRELQLIKNTKLNNELLIVPKYKDVHMNELLPFKVSKESLTRLEKYLNSVSNRVLAIQYLLKPYEIKRIKEFVHHKKSIIYDEQMIYKDISLLLGRLIAHIRLKEKSVEKFKVVDRNDIIHYEKVKVQRDIFNDIKLIVEEVQKNSCKNYSKEELLRMQQEGKQRIEEYSGLPLTSASSTLEQKYKDVTIKYSPQHYYIPYLYSDKEEITYIKHIINVESEVNFIKQLELYLSKTNNLAQRLDVWSFSKIHETFDNIYIPYYENNKLKRFKPDFIFWLYKGNKIKIVFVDPKGAHHTSYQAKVDGYIKLFENKTFTYKNYEVSVDLKLYNKEHISGKYATYWFNHMDRIFTM